MRYFRLLVLGNGISAYGSYLNMVALNVFVYDATGSALAMRPLHGRTPGDQCGVGLGERPASSRPTTASA